LVVASDVTSTASQVTGKNHVNRRQFQQSSEQSRRRAVALGEAGDAQAIGELLDLCRHAAPTVRRAAASALGKLAGNPGIEQAVPVLGELTRDPHPQVRQYALVALARIGDESALPACRDAANRPNEPEYVLSAARGPSSRSRLPPRPGKTSEAGRVTGPDSAVLTCGETAGREVPMDATRRFSDRVEHYVKYRPRYPVAVLDILRGECGLNHGWVVADVGSGTGFLSELLLRNGNRVFGVEPNREMREAGEKLLAAYPRFASVDGRSEATTLVDASVDLVVAGQAFHWFEPVATRREWNRILKATGWTAIVWNHRRHEASAFMRDYGAFMKRHGYERHGQEKLPNHDKEAIRRFLGGNSELHSCPNRQELDWDGLLGRTLSNSRIPLPGTPGYEAMLADLRRLFEVHGQSGNVTIEYQTNVFLGRR
jgi:SAM-dependent methyltransferase